MSSPVNWEVEDVCNFLRENDMGQYSSEFTTHKINGKALMLLNENHLKDLGVNTVIHRLKLMKSISEFRHGAGSLGGGSQSRIQFSSIPAQRQPQSTLPQQNNQVTMRKQLLSPGKSSDVSFDDFKSTQSKGPPSLRGSVGSSVSSIPPPPVKKMAPKPKLGGGAVAPIKRSLRKAPPAMEADPNDDRSPCAYCGRRFAADRLGKHESICVRTSSKQTKVFDSKKQRLTGTDAAAYQGRSREVKIEKNINGVPKYKIVHQQLVESMRAARKLAAYEKALEQGKAVGPPPSLPKIDLVDDDRIQCPSCGRKFGQVQAERHIPNCTGGSIGNVGRGRMNTRGARRY